MAQQAGTTAGGTRAVFSTLFYSKEQLNSLGLFYRPGYFQQSEDLLCFNRALARALVQYPKPPSLRDIYTSYKSILPGKLACPLLPDLLRRVVLGIPDQPEKHTRKALEKLSISYLYLRISQKLLKLGEALSEEQLIHHTFLFSANSFCLILASVTKKSLQITQATRQLKY